MGLVDKDVTFFWNTNLRGMGVKGVVFFRFRSWCPIPIVGTVHPEPSNGPGPTSVQVDDVFNFFVLYDEVWVTLIIVKNHIDLWVPQAVNARVIEVAGRIFWHKGRGSPESADARCGLSNQHFGEKDIVMPTGRAGCIAVRVLSFPGKVAALSIDGGMLAREAGIKVVFADSID